jgi:hypothetical protein
MRFTPKTEDEIAKEGLLPEGTYGFEVFEAEDTISKKGADMIHVKLKVFDGDGGYRYVDDYLLEALLYKLKHFADACGLADEYARGEFQAADVIGKTGEVKIVVGQDKEKLYPPRNNVKDYVVSRPGTAPAVRTAPRKPAMAAADDPFGDEIPF